MQNTTIIRVSKELKLEIDKRRGYMSTSKYLDMVLNSESLPASTYTDILEIKDRLNKIEQLLIPKPGTIENKYEEGR